MAATKWTDAQLSAIETRGKTLLVSAAAGSGKTATLTERIIRSITDEHAPADLSRLLIVTFTRAAAADLKTKISKALSDALANDPANRHLADQIMLLGSARICTIDSFYYDILKSNFSKLSLPGNLRIADTAEMVLLYRAVMEELIDRSYAEDEEFEDFVDHFADLRSTDRVADIFISIYEELLSYREGVDLLLRYEKQLNESADRDFFETPYGEAALTEIRATLTYIRNTLATAEDYFRTDDKLADAYLESFRQDRQCAETLLALTECRRYNEAREVILSHTHLRLKTLRDTDDYTNRLKQMRTKAKDLLAKMKEDIFALPAEDIALYMRTTADICRKTHRFLAAFDRKLAHEKNIRGICDFSDIRRYVMKLIVDENGDPTPLALDLRERFDEIYIDEYQDTDEVQDLIFRTIAKPNNRFMVGDIKQSIYSFRSAEPSIFAGYRRTMPPLGTAESDAFSIFMSNNFRCDQNIIRFSNLVSSYLFRNCGESIEYSAEDDLIFSKSKPAEDYVSPKTVVALTGLRQDTDGEDEPEETPVETDPEALYITHEIRRLIRDERKADGSPIAPRDIAILMRSKSAMTSLMETLQAAGIPACSSEERNFFENPDVLLMLALLSTIDNPQRDVSLSGTLCSPFYGFTLEDLVVLRENGEASMSLFDALEVYAADNTTPLADKCRTFLASLSYWRRQAQALPVEKLLRKLYRELAVLSMQGTDESNLLRLYEYARSFESGGFRGLYGFIRYINEIIDAGTQISDGAGDVDIDAVRLITIHHSKGLEFPVCFIYGAAKKFNISFKRENIQFEPSVGIGFRLHDSSGMGYYDTPIRQAVINRKSTMGREEEMRILYVAMTRARERLYVTAHIKDYEKMRDDARNLAEFGKAFGIIGARSYLEWILGAIEDAGEDSPICDCLTVEKIYAGSLAPIRAALPPTKVKERPETASPPDEHITERLRERFSFVYPFEHVSELPAKLSVSRLYPAVLDESGEYAPTVPLDNTLEDILAEQFTMPQSLELTRETTAADRGTATHTFLQFCDFERAVRTGVPEELARLAEHRFIAPEMTELVNVTQLEAFFRSMLFERIRRARRVWREQRFNIFLPASDFTEDPEKAALLEDETITVQGVIDLFFEDEDGNLILCDYKTDYLTREELAQPTLAAEKLEKRHKQQLAYYARAIREMCGTPPAEVLIYSLPLGDTVTVKM